MEYRDWLELYVEEERSKMMDEERESEDRGEGPCPNLRIRNSEYVCSDPLFGSDYDIVVNEETCRACTDKPGSDRREGGGDRSEFPECVFRVGRGPIVRECTKVPGVRTPVRIGLCRGCTDRQMASVPSPYPDCHWRHLSGTGEWGQGDSRCGYYVGNPLVSTGHCQACDHIDSLQGDIPVAEETEQSFPPCISLRLDADCRTGECMDPLSPWEGLTITPEICGICVNRATSELFPPCSRRTVRSVIGRRFGYVCDETASDHHGDTVIPRTCATCSERTSGETDDPASGPSEEEVEPSECEVRVFDISPCIWRETMEGGDGYRCGNPLLSTFLIGVDASRCARCTGGMEEEETEAPERPETVEAGRTDAESGYPPCIHRAIDPSAHTICCNIFCSHNRQEVAIPDCSDCSERRGSSEVEETDGMEEDDWKTRYPCAHRRDEHTPTCYNMSSHRRLEIVGRIECANCPVREEVAREVEQTIEDEDAYPTCYHRMRSAQRGHVCTNHMRLDTYMGTVDGSQCMTCQNRSTVIPEMESDIDEDRGGSIGIKRQILDAATYISGSISEMNRAWHILADIRTDIENLIGEEGESDG